MTEAENFEDDLFADLYDDNDAPKPAAPPPAAPAPAPAPAVVQPEPVVNNNISYDPVSMPPQQDQAGDEYMGQGQDDEDDDDDVDFNLGGGGAGASHANHGHSHDDASTPPSYGNVHKASAKDDG